MFCLVLFLNLSITATFQPSPLWFCLFIRWRKKPFTDEASKFTNATSKSKACRQKGSCAGCSAIMSELTVDHRSRKDPIRCQRPGKSKPGIGRPIVLPWFHQEVSSHGTRSVRFGRLLLDAKEESNMLRLHLDAASPIIPMSRHRESFFRVGYKD